MTQREPDEFHIDLAELSGHHLIEASAGTGKTWTMVALVLRLVLERAVPLPKILIVTFTKAAAAELRGRLRARLSDAHHALVTGETPNDESLMPLINVSRARSGVDDGTLIKRLQWALAGFDEAAIHTIHAFCQQALGDAAFAAQLPLALDLQEDDNLGRGEAIADRWRQAVHEGAIRGVEGNTVWPLTPSLLASMAHRHETPPAWVPWSQALDNAPLAWQRWPDAPTDVAALKAQLDDLFAQAATRWRSERAPVLACLTAMMDAGVSQQSHKPAKVAIAMSEWDRYLSQGDSLRPLHWDTAKLLTFQGVRVNLPDAYKHPFFGLASDLQTAHQALSLALLAQSRQVIRAVLHDAHQRLRDAKHRQRSVTFHDMLTRLHERLMHEPGLATVLRARYPVALIDEFQDTDALQLAIFRKIYPHASKDQDATPEPSTPQGPVVFVGDPKQAIYAFRGADLQSYISARREATSLSTLVENQRSTPAMVSALHAIFTRHDHPLGHPELTYHAVSAAPRQRPDFLDQRQAEPRLLDRDAAMTLWKLPADDQDGPLTRRQAQAVAVAACAREVASMLVASQTGHVHLGGAPLKGCHVAILVQSHQQGQVMRAALAEVGVAAVELSRRSVFHTQEARELSWLLQGILAPQDMMKLRTALATEMMGTKAEALAATLQGDAESGALLDSTHAQFSAWLALWQRHGIAPMLMTAFDEVNLAARMLVKADGERRMTNWLHLVERLHEAAQAQITPAALMRWFEGERGAVAAGDAATLRLESDRELVQIVTVHRSKGLQWPVVFAPFLWFEKKDTPRSSWQSYHEDDGQHVLDFRRGVLPEAEADAVAARVRLESAEQQLRLIYVALTRAVYRCVLVVDGHVRPAGNKTDNTNLKSKLNWLVAGGGRTLASWLVTEGKAKQKAADLLARRQAIEQGWVAAAVQAGAQGIALVELPASFPAQPRLTPGVAAAVVQRVGSGPIRAAWRVTSFSAWTAHRVGSAWPDAASAKTTSDPTPSPTLSPDDFLHFPKGPSAGDTLHAMLERVDFAAPDTWPWAAAQALQRFPPAGLKSDGLAASPRLLAPEDDASTPPSGEAMLVHLLANLTQTPLNRSATQAEPILLLADVQRGQRLNELAFDLRLHEGRLGDLVRWMQGHRMPMPSLDPALLAERFKGHLRGVIDLVFEHRGRFHVVDWKSNHLGWHPSDYHHDGMAQAMVAHGYHLQHLIYAIAWRRHLQRLVQRHDVDHLWGGAYVLFLRGMRPHWQQPDGRACGVTHWRWPGETLDEAAGCLGLAPWTPAHALPPPLDGINLDHWEADDA